MRVHSLVCREEIVTFGSLPAADFSLNVFLMHLSLLNAFLVAVLKKSAFEKFSGRFSILLCFRPYGNIVI